MKGKYGFCIVIMVLGSTSVTSLAQDRSVNEALVFGFCYALQAAMVCDDISIRIDTEQKIERKAGGEIRGPASPYNKFCMGGLDAAFKDENIADGNKKLCKKAWEFYGCSGTKIPKLLYQRNGAYCKYE